MKSLVNLKEIREIYVEFFGWGGQQKVWAQIFEGRNDILLLGKATKFWVILKNALKLIKIEKNYWENMRKNIKFSDFLILPEGGSWEI